MFYEIYCAKVTIIGIVIIETRVLTDTKFAEASVSAPNLAENIVVAAAIGEQIEIAEDISIVPVTLQIRRIPTAAKGSIMSLSTIAHIHFKSLKVLKISLLVR